MGRLAAVSAVWCAACLWAPSTACRADDPDAVGADFAARDGDADGRLTLVEFAGDGESSSAAARDFRVFDFDGDGSLNVDEFRAMPHASAAARGPMPDPLRALVDRHWQAIVDQWDGVAGDGGISAAQFARLELPVRGEFADWDRDADGMLTRAEARGALDALFGIRALDGTELRSESGTVLQFAHFQNMDADRDQRLTSAEFLAANAEHEHPAEWFAKLDGDGDGVITAAEWGRDPAGRHDVVMQFLTLDQDFDGLVDADEMRSLPEWMVHAYAPSWAAFDDDGDRRWSLREFQMLPQFNMVVPWHFLRTDEDGDGRLSLSEFRWRDGPALDGLRAVYFERLDRDADGTLDPYEWDFISEHPQVKFAHFDADRDGGLSIEEITAASGAELADSQRRDFRLFDFNGDGQLDGHEATNLPAFTQGAGTIQVPDPIVELVQQHLNRLQADWSGWDVDSDGELSAVEFGAAGISALIPGLSAVGFSDWNRDHRGQVSLADAQELLEVAFGVRTGEGRSLRTESGRVVDGRLFRALDPDNDGRLERAAYEFAVRGDAIDPVASYLAIDTGGDGFIDWEEFFVSRHRTDVLAAFRHLDADLSATLSGDELAHAPDAAVARYWLPAFDEGGDGVLSLAEYHLTPSINLLASWESAVDADGDGWLSRWEFRFAEGPDLAGLASVYFDRLDVDANGLLGAEEWTFQSDHPSVRFAVGDVDRNDVLSVDEFARVCGHPRAVAERDFLVFDANGDGALTTVEFRMVPYLVDAGERSPVPDPIVDLVNERLAEMDAAWSAWDADADGVLSAREFERVDLARGTPGLELSGFPDWDRGDGAVSRDDCRWLLEIAYGVRSSTGALLRTESGRVVHFAHFQNMDADRNGTLTHEEFLDGNPGNSEADAWFARVDGDGDGSVTLAEWRDDPGGHYDLPAQFLAMDADLDGTLDEEELFHAAPWMREPYQYTFRAFDGDGSGDISFREFLALPQFNLVVAWHFPRSDLNGDGALSLAEFRWNDAPGMSALCCEYFARLDVNQDRRLSVDEWDMVLDPAKAPRDVVFRQRDADASGDLSFDEVLAGRALRPQEGAEFDPSRDALLVHVEEAFRRADSDGNGTLSLPEFDSDDALEAMAPGAGALSQQIELPSRWADSLGLTNASLRTYLIVGFNLLLLASVIAYTVTKARRA